MSKWTHISGCIRVDSFGMFDKSKDNKEFQIERILGPVSTWEEYNKKCKLPLGSEGSLNYDIWTNPQESSLFKYSIQFFGDLRDYDNIKEIEKWFAKTCKELNDTKNNLTIIRDGILYVEIEYKDTVILYFDDNKIVKCIKTKERIGE